MNETEVNIILTKIEECKKEVTKSKEASKDFLIKAGILTKAGKLSQPYKNLSSVRPESTKAQLKV